MSTDLAKLVEFIAAARTHGVADDSVVSLLRQNGWSERRIFQAFTAYYDEKLGIPVPSRGTKIEQARDAFLYLLAFITLGFWTVALVLFADSYVDHVLPSALDYPYQLDTFRHTVAGQLATLLLAFPLFIFVSNIIMREIGRRPELFESGVRKWLTYIALVITAVTLLSDAVWFLSTFLGGDLTARFAWKAVVLFVVAAGVFWYYLGSMRLENINPARERSFGLAATAVIVLAVVLGFASIGSPAHQRAYSLDEQRVQRMGQMQDAIHRYWKFPAEPGKNTRPPLLGQLHMYSVNAKDPASGRPFDFQTGAWPKYTLCTTFDEDNTGATLSRWVHPAGYYCFRLDARDEPSPGYPAPYLSQ